MIRWIGKFRDECNNSLYEVIISHSLKEDISKTISTDGTAKVGRGIYTLTVSLLDLDIDYTINSVNEGLTNITAIVEDEYTFTNVVGDIEYQNLPEMRELKLVGESPVIINYEGEDDNIYKPCKYSSCTIKLLSDWYDEDLYSKSIYDNKVSIFKGNILIWEGYLTPNVYNQGFAYSVEELELEAIDSLSALRYKKYDGTKEVVSANHIFNKTLSDFDTLYIQNNNYIGDVENSVSSQIEGFTILDYLMTDGKAYIDTGYYPSDTTRVSSDFSVNYENIGGLTSVIYGAESERRASIILSVGDYDTVHDVGYLTCTFCANQIRSAYNKSFAIKRNLEMGYKYSNNLDRYASVKYDNVENDFECYALDRSDKSMYIFGCNTYFDIDGHPRDICAGTAIGRFIVYEEQYGTKTTVLDLYPVKRISDGKLGMYDVVSDYFYMNSGAGAFIQGSPEGDSNKYLSETEFSTNIDITKIQLSEYPFYDEDKKEFESSNVLIEEICKYLGYTAIGRGRELFFIDYSDITSPFNKYIKGNNGFVFSNTINLTNNKEWTKDDYADDNTLLSLNSVYRKVTLSNDLDDFEDLTDKLFDKVYNLWTNERYDTDKGSIFFDENRKVALYDVEALTSDSVQVQVYRETTLSGQPITVGYLDNEAVFPSYYNSENSFTAMSNDGLNWGCLLNAASLAYSAGSIPATQYHAQTFGKDSNYIMLSANPQAQDAELITFYLNSKSIVQTTKAYYVINFLLMWSTEYFPCENLGDWNYETNFTNLYTRCQFKYGNLYWNGSNWQTDKCSFNIQLDAKGESTVKPLNQTFTVNNMIDYKTGLELEGYIIPIPNGTDANIGSVEFSFLRPNKFENNNIKAIFINELSINLTFKKKEKERDIEDTEQVIDDSYAEDKELDECKFGTFDDNHLCYNTVGYLVGAEYYIIKKIKWKDWICKPEEARVYKYVLQYSHPRKQLDILLNDVYNIPYTTFTNFNFGNIKFILDTWEIDLKSNTTNLKLIESRL